MRAMTAGLLMGAALCSSGCLGGVLLGAAAGAGIILVAAEDTVEMEAVTSYADAEKACKAAIHDHGGFLETDSTTHSAGKQTIEIESTVEQTTIKVKIAPTTKEGRLKISVQGRKTADLLPDTKTAERVLTTVRDKLNIEPAGP